MVTKKRRSFYEHKCIPAGHLLRRAVKSAGDGPGQAPDQGAKSQTQGQEAQEKRKKVDFNIGCFPARHV